MGGVCPIICWDTHPWTDTHTHHVGRHPPGRHPLGRHPTGRHTPPGQTPPWADTPHPLGYYGIWTTRGRYASYWNAYLYTYMCFFIVNKDCASGFHFDGDNNLCVRCPNGTYQDIQVHLNITCKSCSGKKSHYYWMLPSVIVC